MEGKAKILIYGFSAEEGERIDDALAGVRVPSTTKLRPTQGHVELAEIIAHDRDGSEAFSCSQPLVLFYNVSEAGIRTLIPYIRNLNVPRPIFAMVTETSYRWTLARLLEHLIEEKRVVERRAAENRAAASSEPEAQSGQEAQSEPEGS
jgi:hypothetical protein